MDFQVLMTRTEYVVLVSSKLNVTHTNTPY